MPSGTSVAIRGSGVAATCCEALLRRSGIAVSSDRSARGGVPIVLVSPATQSLFADVFSRADLFAGCHRLERRVVGWGGRPPVSLPHAAAVLPEAALLDRFRASASPGPERPDSSPAWTLHTVPPLPGNAVKAAFGDRQATLHAVTLAPAADPSACVMEALESGWLFLAPSGPRTAWLVAAGECGPDPVAKSRLIAPQLESIEPAFGCFACHPAIADELCGAGWLACGTAAIAFDPIAGDGTGNAAREAILASAVIEAIAVGGDAEELFDEYRLRLRAGFRKHLELCDPFYASGGGSGWWLEAREGIRRGLDTFSRDTLARAPSRFRLNGWRLERAPV